MTPVVWSNKLKLVTQPNNDYGQLLNEVISQLNTSYVLFLHDTDYLSPTVQPNSLKIPVEKSVLGTFHHSRNMVIHRPRSEERRVGKECRTRRWRGNYG